MQTVSTSVIAAGIGLGLLSVFGTVAFMLIEGFQAAFGKEQVTPRHEIDPNTFTAEDARITL